MGGGRRTVAAFEFLENGGALLDRHAGTRVLDGKDDAIVWPTRHAQADAATVGIFDGVAGEINEDLAQARGVADEARGHIGGDMRGDLDALALRARRNQFDHALDQWRQFEGRAIELEAAGFDPGEVENFVYERAERLAGGADGGQIGLGFGVELHRSEQVGHAENAVERRADLVADGGEKARLGLAGGFRAFARGGGGLQFPDLVAQALSLLLHRLRRSALAADRLAEATPEQDARHERGQSRCEECQQIRRHDFRPGAGNWRSDSLAPPS